MDNKKSIGCVGNGFVGKILKKYYPEMLVYDILNSPNSLEDVLACDIIFIAFNLKDNGIDSYDEIKRYPGKARDGRIFIIKSTFIPSTCDRLQQDFPRHYFIYNPEFLTERTAWEDFTKPQFQILGATHQSLHLVDDIFAILPDAPVKRVISPLDAEIFKHAKNSYYAMKVIFFNQFYDMCMKLGGDYETLREILVQDPWVGDSHSIIYHNGYRGFGGKCLSKDPHALYKISSSPLLKAVIDINNEYLQSK